MDLSTSAMTPKVTSSRMAIAKAAIASIANASQKSAATRATFPRGMPVTTMRCGSTASAPGAATRDRSCLDALVISIVAISLILDRRSWSAKAARDYGLAGGTELGGEVVGGGTAVGGGGGGAGGVDGEGPCRPPLPVEGVVSWTGLGATGAAGAKVSGGETRDDAP